jgi:hypothetical protein
MHRRGRAVPRAGTIVRRWRTVVGLGMALMVTGCDLLGGGSFVDFEAFDPLPPLGRLDLTDGLAQGGIVYWELRLGGLGAEVDDVVAEGGVADPSEFGSDVLAALDTLKAMRGFRQACLPGGCFYYLAGLTADGDLRSWETDQELEELLVPIQSPSEAALLALAAGYDWSAPLEEGAFRPEGEDWHLVVTRYTGFCDPVREDRFLLEVTRDGSILVLKSEELRTQDGVCI